MQALGPPPRPDSYIPDLSGRPRPVSHGDGTRFWLARHSFVESDWQSIAYGSLDAPLSEEGLRATDALAEAFSSVSIDAVIASDLSRARLLGERIAARPELRVSTSPKLREINRGDWQGIPKEEFITKWHAQGELYWRDPYRWNTPGGEGDESLFARAWPEVEAALSRVRGGCLVLAAHGQINRVLISRLLDLDVPESYEHYLDPTHATCLVDTPQGWRCEAHNWAAADFG